jgi:Cu+-exporting ATPase
MEKDPVCGMKIDKKTARFTSEHAGKMFFFCSQACKAKFDANPMKYMTR